MDWGWWRNWVKFDTKKLVILIVANVNDKNSPCCSSIKGKAFWRNRKSPDYIENRSSCDGIKKSEQQGETWKHRQIVAEIKYYLENDGKLHHDVMRFESKGVFNDEPDLIITHNGILPNFSSSVTRILVRMFNYRRQRLIMDKYSDCIVIEAHRWQSSEVNDNNFMIISEKSRLYLFHGARRWLNYYQSMNHSTFIPISLIDEEMKK